MPITKQCRNRGLRSLPGRRLQQAGQPARVDCPAAPAGRAVQPTAAGSMAAGRRRAARQPGRKPKQPERLDTRRIGRSVFILAPRSAAQTCQFNIGKQWRGPRVGTRCPSKVDSSVLTATGGAAPAICHCQRRAGPVSAGCVGRRCRRASTDPRS